MTDPSEIPLTLVTVTRTVFVFTTPAVIARPACPTVPEMLDSPPRTTVSPSDAPVTVNSCEVFARLAKEAGVVKTADIVPVADAIFAVLASPPVKVCQEAKEEPVPPI